LIFRVKTNFAQCLLSLKDQKNQSNHLVCPALANIDEKTFEKLKKTTVETDTDNLIQTTFGCKTER